MSRLQGGLVAPLAGWAIDRYGPRRMMFLGLSMMGIGFFAMSQVNSLIMLYIVFIVLLGAGASFGTSRPVQVSLANWFIRRRGLVMGLMMTGLGLGGSVVFLFALLIDTFGWRASAIFAGLVMWGIGFPLALVIRHRPEQMGLLPDGNQPPTEAPIPVVAGGATSPPNEGEPSDSASATPQTPRPHRFWMRDPRPEIDLTVWQAFRTQAFWLMALTYAMWAAMPGIITVHIGPFLAEELDLDYVVALGALSFFAATSLIGRIGFGFLADYVNIRLLLASLLVMQGVGLLLFSQVQTLAQVPFYVIVFSIPYGGTLPMRQVLQGYLFGKRQFGTIGGFLQFVDLPATATAPIWVGLLADALPGGYRIGFQALAAMLVVAAVAVLLTRRPRPPLPADHPPLLLLAFRRRKGTPVSPLGDSTSNARGGRP